MRTPKSDGFQYRTAGADGPEKPPPSDVIEYRIDEVLIAVKIGKWRGSRKLDELSPQQPLRLFALDDEEPQPYGRALEQLLAEWISKAAGLPPSPEIS